MSFLYSTDIIQTRTEVRNGQNKSSTIKVKTKQTNKETTEYMFHLDFQ